MYGKPHQERCSHSVISSLFQNAGKLTYVSLNITLTKVRSSSELSIVDFRDINALFIRHGIEKGKCNHYPTRKSFQFTFSRKKR